MNNQSEMRAALLEKVGEPLEVKRVPRVAPNAQELLVRVRATAVLPHQRIAFSGLGPFLLPELPAMVGWDVCGEVLEVGVGVSGFSKGDRVYVHPIISCGNCDYCHRGAPLLCERYMLLGGFGLSEGSRELQKRHRAGGFAEYMNVPAGNAVRIPADVDYSNGTRIGYAGVAYRALVRGEVGPGKNVAVIGATGNLGVPATKLALAMGADRVTAIARDTGKLEQLRDWIDDRRLQIVSVDRDGPDLGDRDTVDVVVDLLDESRGARPEQVRESLNRLAPGGTAVLVGVMTQPVPVDYMALVTGDRKIVGSHGFTLREARELVAMIKSGVFSFPKFDTHTFGLTEVNAALNLAWERPGGFTNIVVTP